MNEKLAGGIIPWFAQNPVAANLLMLLVIALGVLAADDLRKEAFPSMEPDTITVSVVYPSGSAEQSEEGLAMKIEDQLQDVTGIKTITSVSNGSGTTVTIEKQSDYDLDTLMNDVKSRVDAISRFPSEAEQPVIEKGEREQHALWIQLYGDTDRHALQTLAVDLQNELINEDNISRVTVSGWQDPMMVVAIDEGKLQAYGLSLSDVEDIINNNSSRTTTAVLSNEDNYLQLRASEQAYLSTDFAAIPLLTGADGRQVMLGDVATISDTFDDETAVLSRFQGQSSLALQVVTTGVDDISDSVVAARAKVEEWRASGRLPANVSLDTWYDRSEQINDRLDLLIRNAMTGIVLVFLFLALFLNLKVAFWVAAGLPFIFFGTLYFMGDDYMGLTLNEFTTFGFILALGIVVDDAVVVGESVYAQRRRYGDSVKNTIDGTMLVAMPTLFGVFTTVVAFYALSNISGRLGNLYAQFAAVVAICLLLSIVESKLILPAHLAHLNTRPKRSGFFLLRWWQWLQSGADHGMTWLTNHVYRPFIGVAMRYRYAVTVLFVALFVLVMSMPFNGTVQMSFFPRIPGDTVRAELTMQKDASFGMTHQVLLDLEQMAYELDTELRGDVRTESAIANLQVVASGNQSGSLRVELSEDAPYNIDDFTRAWQQQAGMPPGVRNLRIRNAPEMVDALRIELRANDDALLMAAGEYIREQMLLIPAITGIEENLDPSQPQLKLKLTQQGRAMGLNTDDLALQVLQGFRGQAVQRYQRNKDEIEVRVRYPDEDRANPSDVLNADVRGPNGEILPLSSVATVEFGYTRDSITRINARRAAYLSADVDKDVQSATELVAQLNHNMVPQLKREFPGLDIHFGGEAEEQAETESSMVSMFALAMLGIYMLLAIPLKSYVQPLLIMTAIPFGIVGAVLGHWVNDLALGILSLNGIIALSGVVVNDSLLLAARFNDLRARHASVRDAVIEACCSRMRAVLLTSMTTFFGLMPLLKETSRQAQFLIPAAVSLGYGIMFATLITLILIPSLLMIQHDGVRLWRWYRRALGVGKSKEASCQASS